MAPEFVDLGGLDLVSTTSGLQLQLSSVAHFAPSTKDDDAVEALTAQVLNTDRRKRPWLYRARSFCLSLGLRVADDVQVLAKDETIQRLTAAIQETKLWHQLRLRPTSVEASSWDASGSTLITIALSHDDETPNQVRRSIHKLGVDVPVHDVQPPPSLPSCALESIHLAMNISRAPRRKRRKIDILAEEADATPKDCADDDLMSPGLALPQAPEATKLASDGDFDDLLLAYFDGDTTQDATMPHHENDNKAVKDEVPKIARLRKRSSSISEAIFEPEAEALGTVEATAMLHLVDAAIRLAICDTPKRLGKGMRVSNSNHLEHLSDIAPSVWSPGYLSAISTRAIFLPTISHALSAVGRQTGSASLRSKIEELSSRRTPAMVDSQESITVHLWQLIQSELHDGKAARRLKTLAFTGTAANSAVDDDDALDAHEGSQQSSQEAGIEVDCDIDDFDEFGEPELFEHDLFDSVLFDYDDDNDIMDNLGDHTSPGLWRLEQLLDKPSLNPELIAAKMSSSTSTSRCTSHVLASPDGEDEDDLLSLCGSSVGPLSTVGEGREVIVPGDEYFLDGSYVEERPGAVAQTTGNGEKHFVGYTSLDFEVHEMLSI